MKIYKARGGDKLSAYELTEVKRQLPKAVWFIYWYETGSYDGTGFAIWKNEDGKFGYSYLGHCSCNGPVDYLESIPYTLEEVEKIIDKNYQSEYYHSNEVLKKAKQRNELK